MRTYNALQAALAARAERAASYKNGLLPKYEPIKGTVDQDRHFWQAVTHFHNSFLRQSGVVSHKLDETFPRQEANLRFIDTEIGSLPASQHRATLGLGRLIGDGQLIVVTKPATARSLPVGDVFSYMTLFRSIDVAHDVTLADDCERLDALAVEPLTRTDFQTFLTEMHLGAGRIDAQAHSQAAATA